jgi:hypothetical protein
MNANWTKKTNDDDILQQVSKEFSGLGYEIEFYVKSDDGGRHIEARVNGEQNGSTFRKILPLNYNGWRTVVVTIK